MVLGWIEKIVRGFPVAKKLKSGAWVDKFRIIFH